MPVRRHHPPPTHGCNVERARVLVIDDEQAMLENCERLLSREGYICTTLAEPLRFRQVAAEVDPDVIITDLRMPGADGLTILAAAVADDRTRPVILMTAFATVASAVAAVREGAFDYITKPFTADQLLVAVERAARYRRLTVENRTLRQQVELTQGGDGILGSSVVMQRLLEQAAKVAPTDANVLITGESGTGKELMALFMHAHSLRQAKPFVTVDCAAMPEGLLESELFGHERGAFTGAVQRTDGLLAKANGGTVFFDEIAELGTSLQSKLLRALEQRQIRRLGDSRLINLDIRVVAATNHELEVTAEVWTILERHPWPGNVRELRNTAQRLVVLDNDGQITPEDLDDALQPRVKLREGEPAREPASWQLSYSEAQDKALRDFRAAYV